MSMTRLLTLGIASIVLLCIIAGGGYHIVKAQGGLKEQWFYWRQYHKLNGYYNGVRTLVRIGEYEPQNRYNQSEPPELVPAKRMSTGPTLDPVVYNPYPEYKSDEYRKEHHGVAECFLDAEETVSPPDIYAYPGLPQYHPQPAYGSYTELGLTEDVCFDRFGRLGPYGFGYNESMGRKAPDLSEHVGIEKIFEKVGHINYTNVDWGAAQKRCVEKNSARFAKAQANGKKRIPRHAYVLRTYTEFEYSKHQIFTLRALISELALKSGGEYDVHLLVHVKDDNIPIWADERVYNETLQNAVPREFWNITTLWSEQQMKMYYPDPFPGNFANNAGSSVHGVYRSGHFALQWFSRQHPEYDFFWNWEMDIRYSGHYYEFHTKIGEWANRQPRKGLWERSQRFWFPGYHGDYQNFTKFVERETIETDMPKNDLEKNGPIPVWGPYQDFKNYGMLPPPDETKPPTSYEKDNYQWGVGEEADLLVFNPIFDVYQTNWVFRADITGYNLSLPIPPRRAAIVTASRMSRRLLDVMHEEVWRQRHTMFPEMFAPSMCLHHGLKAVYIPHPVYFDRDWDLANMNKVFNYPTSPISSPFGWGENLFIGSSFYYTSFWSPRLWRRWLGQTNLDEGGRKKEERGTGRMCLRGMLFHPVKHEADEPG